MDKILRFDFIQKNDLVVVILLIFGLLIFATLLFFIVGKIKPEANLTELKARTRSWWIMATIFIGTTIINTNISYIAL